MSDVNWRILDGIKRNVKSREEILVSMDLPTDARGLRASYQKFRVREAWDFPELAVAAAMRLDAGRIADLRLVANAVASIPLWMDETAAKFNGRPLTDETIDAVADAITARASVATSINRPRRSMMLVTGHFFSH